MSLSHLFLGIVNLTIRDLVWSEVELPFMFQSMGLWRKRWSWPLIKLKHAMRSTIIIPISACYILFGVMKCYNYLMRM